MEKLLIEFGNYVLSEKRENNLLNDINKRSVTDADIANFKHKLEKKFKKKTKKVCNILDVDSKELFYAIDNNSIIIKYLGISPFCSKLDNIERVCIINGSGITISRAHDELINGWNNLRIMIKNFIYYTKPIEWD